MIADTDEKINECIKKSLSAIGRPIVLKGVSEIRNINKQQEYVSPCMYACNVPEYFIIFCENGVSSITI